MHKLIAETKSSNFDKIMKVYAENPHRARVLFLNNNLDIINNRLVLYEDGDDFAFVIYKKKYGISITNKRYSNEKISSSIRYKNGKFYYTGNKLIRPLTMRILNSFIFQFYGYGYDKLNFDNYVINYLIKKFSWIRFIFEHSILNNKSFNTFVRYKLYNYNDSIKYFLKLPLPVCKEIINGLSLKNDDDDIFKRWTYIKSNLINLESFKSELVKDNYFSDTCRLAKILDRKINCKWGSKRLKMEHDNWSAEINDILISCEELRDLNIHPIFLKFAESSDYRILKTNKDLMSEGFKQKHCVATYVNYIEGGFSGIYHINGYTLELKIRNNELYINQFRGYKNEDAPESLYNEVNNKLNDFNLMDYKLNDKFIPKKSNIFESTLLF
jgi:hypothetical protein